MTTKTELYKKQLRQLLPPGRALPVPRNSFMDWLTEALAYELGWIDTRGDDLLRESLPDTTDELLSDWERVAGLPSECMRGVAQTKAERRNALVARLSDVGDVTPAGIVSFAASLGYDITVTEFTPFEAGSGYAGAPVCSEDWVFVLLITASDQTISDFRVGLSSVGEALRSWGNERLECFLLEVVQAHWYILFAYEG